MKLYISAASWSWGEDASLTSVKKLAPDHNLWDFLDQTKGMKTATGETSTDRVTAVHCTQKELPDGEMAPKSENLGAFGH